MKIEPKANCPLNKFEPCKEMDCSWFMKVAGTHPNTGEMLEDWNCAVTWIPVMLMENGRQQHGTASAIESFRNEMVKSSDVSAQVLMAIAQEKLINPTMILENKE